MRKLMNPRQAGITAIPGSRSKPASTPLSLSTPGYAQTFDRDYVVRGRDGALRPEPGHRRCGVGGPEGAYAAVAE